MVRIHTIDIEPPLMNASCAWASEFSQLKELYGCPDIGAVTTRTATLQGFSENETNTVAFSSLTSTSLNSYGYSPHSLETYTSWVFTILTTTRSLPTKPVIISVAAADPTVLSMMLDKIVKLRQNVQAHYASYHRHNSTLPNSAGLIAVELNTSCPNIEGSPPPSYNFPSLHPLLEVLASLYRSDQSWTIGLKLPPYIYLAQFKEVVATLSTYTGPSESSPFAYIACTNTLGSSLLFAHQCYGPGSDNSDDRCFALPTPLGGLGGEAIHPLALGNVYTFHQLLQQQNSDAMQKLAIVGIGGVATAAGFDRMVDAGAKVVACATLLGQKGVDGFRTLMGSSDRL